MWGSLQVGGIRGGGGGGSQRLLRLKVTDGKALAVAAEYRPMEHLHANLPPGTKLLFTDAHIQSGIIMLQGKMVQVLGGRVGALAHEWEVPPSLFLQLQLISALWIQQHGYVPNFPQQGRG